MIRKASHPKRRRRLANSKKGQSSSRDKIQAWLNLDDRKEWDAGFKYRPDKMSESALVAAIMLREARNAARRKDWDLPEEGDETIRFSLSTELLKMFEFSLDRYSQGVEPAEALRRILYREVSDALSQESWDIPSNEKLSDISNQIKEKYASYSKQVKSN